MPPTRIDFYVADDGTVPVLEWLRALGRRQPQASDKCYAVLQRLRMLGYELRRPVADHVEADIRELRTRFGNTNYRILYAFHGQGAAVVPHGFTKERPHSGRGDRACETTTAAPSRGPRGTST